MSLQPVRPVVCKAERALARVETGVAALRRKARNTRIVALAMIPLVGFSFYQIFHVYVSYFNDGTLDRIFVYSSCCVFLALSMYGIRLLIRRAIGFDRQATHITRQFASSPGVVLAPVNMSKLSASTSSTGIVRRMWWTRCLRMMNVAGLLVAALLFASGWIFVFMIIQEAFDDRVVSEPLMESGGALDVILLFVSSIFITVGGASCSIFLKLGQRLIEAQESLVEVSVYMAEAEAQPGSLQLASSVSQDGRLSVDVQDGALTQAPLNEGHDQ